MKLSILICTLPGRRAMFERLKTELHGQMLPYAGEVEILSAGETTLMNGPAWIGYKRNGLLAAAHGEYVCFVDDDDWICPRYIDILMNAIESGCDCASLIGEITFDGYDNAIFEHSIKYNQYRTNEDRGAPVKYERYPNHLNLIKASIAKQFKFPEINHGEDTNWATQIHESGLLKNEYPVKEIIYYYRYVTKKTAHV